MKSAARCEALVLGNSRRCLKWAREVSNDSRHVFCTQHYKLWLKGKVALF